MTRSIIFEFMDSFFMEIYTKVLLHYVDKQKACERPRGITRKKKINYHNQFRKCQRSLERATTQIPRTRSHDLAQEKLDRLWSYRSYNQNHRYDDTIRIRHLQCPKQQDPHAPRWILWVTSNYLHSGEWSSYCSCYFDRNSFILDHSSFISYFSFFMSFFNLDNCSISFIFNLNDT